MSGDIRVWDTLFYGGVKTYDLGSRAHILKQIYDRIICGPFEKRFHEGTILRGPRAVIYFFLKQKILRFNNLGNRFYNQ